MARLLKDAGYATDMAGKWRQVGETPRDWGFDEYTTDPTAGGWFWKDNHSRNGAEFTETAQLLDASCADALYEDNIRYMDNQVGAVVAELEKLGLRDKTLILFAGFASQLQGKTGTPRDSVYVQLGKKWYVREANYKMNEAGELFDMPGRLILRVAFLD